MISCVGVGPGDPDLVTLKARQLIETADVVAGFTAVNRIIHSLIRGERVDLTYPNQTERLDYLAKQHQLGKRCVVCFMGDANFSGYQLLERVEAAVGGRVDLIPGISSAQMVASQARVPFDQTIFVTFHKRGDLEEEKRFLGQALRWGRHAIVIPRPWDFMPKDIAADLLAQGLPAQTPVSVYQNLCQAEVVVNSTLGELKEECSDMSIVLIRSPAS